MIDQIPTVIIEADDTHRTVASLEDERIQIRHECRTLWQKGPWRPQENTGSDFPVSALNTLCDLVGRRGRTVDVVDVDIDVDVAPEEHPVEAATLKAMATYIAAHGCLVKTIPGTETERSRCADDDEPCLVCFVRRTLATLPQTNAG